jgi:hypothetical protein
MCVKLILIGNSLSETDVVRQIMDARGITYRFEAGGASDEPPTLITPGGRYCGAEVIRGLFGGPTAPLTAESCCR